MSWDDEDFAVPTSSNSNAVTASWEDEGDDEPVLESWDVDSEEEREKAKEKAKEERKNAKHGKNTLGNKSKVLMDIDLVDEQTRAELLKKAQLESDLNNAASLFDGLGVADEHPRAKAARLEQEKLQNLATNSSSISNKDAPLATNPIFHPETKQDYEKLRKTIAPLLTALADQSLLNYTSSLAIDLIRDLCKPLSMENVRKVNSTLNVLIKEKEREERQARLSKAGGTSQGGAGKKKAKSVARPSLGNSSFKKDLDVDTTNYEDDFGEDDFM
ncbi:hypothetical protein PACTADRAFT_74070 [Pachysolen tannophilus NRRL Y-2460]|uniref:Eukaryotic translation initiation factor 3 subunit J n=1 Tax=Pachysolen tannophilus NRRL Y-2460 TaxID=669874 RepID=A0A1E4U3F5_PACTA|nr:hypothetical protein PACTADRAFT_74070 [Pachysolen tannophilus NRRL Y-2460]